MYVNYGADGYATRPADDPWWLCPCRSALPFVHMLSRRNRVFNPGHRRNRGTCCMFRAPLCLVAPVVKRFRLSIIDIRSETLSASDASIEVLGGFHACFWISTCRRSLWCAELHRAMNAAGVATGVVVHLACATLHHPVPCKCCSTPWHISSSTCTFISFIAAGKVVQG